MLKLEELKPILQELIPEDKMAETIEKVQALDTHPEGGEPGEDYVKKTEYDRLNSEWNERFKKAFFGAPDDAAKDAAAGKPMETPEDKSDPEVFTLEALLQS